MNMPEAYFESEFSMLVRLKQNASWMGYVGEILYYDVDFIMKAVKINGLCLEYLAAYKHTSLEETITYEAVMQNGLALQFARMRPEYIVEAAFWKNWRALKFVPEFVPTKEMLRYLMTLINPLRIARKATLECALRNGTGVWLDRLWVHVQLFRQRWFTKVVVKHKTGRDIF